MCQCGSDPGVPVESAESVESTAWWRRDAAERAATGGDEAGEGEDGPGLDEHKFRQRFFYLFHDTEPCA